MNYKEYAEMIWESYSSINRWSRLFTFLTSIIALSLLIGCVTGENYGKTQRDRDLDNMFLRYEVLPDHNYYTSGGYNKPDAILALHKDYELDNTRTYWRFIPNVDYAQMRKWIDTIAPEQDYRYSNAYFAAYILDTDGKKIGAWYSIDPHATVQFLEGNKILVYTPTPELNIDIRGRRRPTSP
jgi:hypothetical protein